MGWRDGETEGAWEKVGEVSVDAGMVWLGDPCYVMGDDASERVHDWVKDFCEKLPEDAVTVSEPLGRGVGFGVPSGYGDGSYPVYIQRNYDRRVKALKVVFDFEENDEPEDEECQDPECINEWCDGYSCEFEEPDDEDDDEDVTEDEK